MSVRRNRPFLDRLCSGAQFRNEVSFPSSGAEATLRVAWGAREGDPLREAAVEVAPGDERTLRVVPLHLRPNAGFSPHPPRELTLRLGYYMQRTAESTRKGTGRYKETKDFEEHVVCWHAWRPAHDS